MPWSLASAFFSRQPSHATAPLREANTESFIRVEMQEMLYFVRAECPNYRGQDIEGNRLQHQALSRKGSLPSEPLQVPRFASAPNNGPAVVLTIRPAYFRLPAVTAQRAARCQLERFDTRRAGSSGLDPRNLIVNSANFTDVAAGVP